MDKMKAWQKGWWKPFLIFLLATPALTPLLGSNLMRSFDGLLHLHRLIQLDRLIGEGVLFSRWAPDLVFGYGYPLFNFYASLPYYLAELIHLIGLDFVDSALAFFALCLTLSGLTIYLFAKDIFGERSALLAAVAYIYAPYHLYDLFRRSAMGSLLATVIVPLLFWASYRLISTGQGRYLVTLALTYGVLILSHNVSALIVTPLLILYLALLLLRRRKVAWMAVAALALGLGMAAFFWLPALAEREAIQVDRLITPPDFDFHNYFPSLGQLFSPPPPADVGRMNPEVPNTLGLTHSLLALLALFALWRPKGEGVRFHVGYSFLALLGLIFMMQPLSTPLWEDLPFLAYLQFPHRFLGPASFFVALLVGAAIHPLPAGKGLSSPAFLASTFAIALILVSSLSLLYPHYLPPFPQSPSLVTMMESEHETGAIGTTASGEYLPVWVEWIPKASPLEGFYRSGSPIDRVDHATLPPGSELRDSLFRPTSAFLSLYTPQPFQLTFQSFYFPGWAAYIDGTAVPIAPTPGFGLISLSVPEGEHRVILRFEETPIRKVADLISGISLLIVTALGAHTFRRGFKETQRLPPRLTGKEGGVLALLALAILLLKVGYIDHSDTPFKWGFDGERVRGVEHPLSYNFGNQITLLGYHLDYSEVTPGNSLHLTLYWKAQRPLNTAYSSFAHLIDQQLNIYAQQDNLHPGRYPTVHWEADEYNQDEHEIPIPPATPPGEYLLVVGLYDPQTLERLPVRPERGEPPEDAVILQSITVSAKTTGG